MAYKKSAEEIKWLKWKATEEQKLRAFGVNEDVIARLRTADWADFKKERNYQVRETAAQEYTELQPEKPTEQMVLTVQDLLDSIENSKLLTLLVKTDELTLQILVFKTIGLTSKEIAKKLHISPNAVDLRVWRIKEKVKNIF